MQSHQLLTNPPNGDSRRPSTAARCFSSQSLGNGGTRAPPPPQRRLPPAPRPASPRRLPPWPMRPCPSSRISSPEGWRQPSPRRPSPPSRGSSCCYRCSTLASKSPPTSSTRASSTAWCASRGSRASFPSGAATWPT